MGLRGDSGRQWESGETVDPHCQGRQWGSGETVGVRGDPVSPLTRTVSPDPVGDSGSPRGDSVSGETVGLRGDSQWETVGVRGDSGSQGLP